MKIRWSKLEPKMPTICYDHEDGIFTILGLAWDIQRKNKGVNVLCIDFNIEYWLDKKWFSFYIGRICKTDPKEGYVFHIQFLWLYFYMDLQEHFRPDQVMTFEDADLYYEKRKSKLNLTMFSFVRGMIQGLCNEYNVEQEDLDLLLEKYEKLEIPSPFEKGES